MRSRAILSVFALILPAPVMGQGTFRVRFDQSTYTILPEATVSVGVVIDPVPAVGLFSFGFKALFDEARARVESASSVSIPAPIDFNGVMGPGAMRTIQAGFAGVKGTIDFAVAPGMSYRGANLATILLKDLGNTVGTEYLLSLEIYRTLGPAETVFVGGDGAGLDGEIIFGSAVVHVVPEPRAVVLACLAFIFWIWSCRGCRVGRWDRLPNVS
jgi:hypothetical protein